MHPTHHFDVLILGGGAVGCAVARELARYRLSIALVEKEADVAAGTSGRNSAVVHAGFNNRPGSLMARLCVAGNRGFPALCRELDVPFRKTGKILVAFDREVQEIRAAIARTTEETQQRVDWTQLWGERYPVLTTYQQVVDVEGYAAPLKGLLARLEETYGYSREDAFLVLKDILGNVWQGKA